LRDKFEDLGLGLHEPRLAGDMALVELVAHPLGLDRFHNGAVAVDPDLLGSEDGLVEGINKSLPVDRDGAFFLLSTIRGALKSVLRSWRRTAFSYRRGQARGPCRYSCRAQHQTSRPILFAIFPRETGPPVEATLPTVSPDEFRRERNQDDCGYDQQSQLHPKVIEQATTACLTTLHVHL
jgi:hypothetical protein